MKMENVTKLDHYEILSAMGGNGMSEFFWLKLPNSKVKILNWSLAVSYESNRAAELRREFFVSGSGLLPVQKGYFSDSFPIRL